MISILCHRFFSHLNELHEAGLVPAPYRTDQQDKFEKAFLTYMRDGNFDSFRYVLKGVEERANTPNVPTLRERLEKLSDRWDAALICKIEAVFGADSAIDRSAIQTYQKQGDQLIPCKPVFVGSMAEC